MNSRLKLILISTSTLLAVMLLVGSVMGHSAEPSDAYRHLAVYTEVLSRIKSEYVEEPDIKSVTLGAMNGMLEAIDPYASYLNADQYKQYMQTRETKKADVGLVLSKKFGYVAVVGSVPGNSAAKAGLATGDLIESIHGIATRDMPLAYAEMILAGEPNTPVEISVLRLRKPEPQKMTLMRAPLKYPALTAKMASPEIGLVEVGELESGKVKEVADAFQQLQKQGAKKFVLDLRNASIGTPEDGIALANLFLEKGLITYLQGQKVARKDFEADPAKAQFRQEPLVVLANRGTASASEIAAAALEDSKRAKVVGERTYGDAAFRRAVTMDDGAAVILSVAKYYSPSGKAIQDTGVTPTDAVIEAEPAAEADDDSAVQPEPKKPEGDPGLKRAIEILTGTSESAGGILAPETMRPTPDVTGRIRSAPLKQ